MRKDILQKYDLPELESGRQQFLKFMLSTCFDKPSEAQSSLIDLPLERPQISYNKLGNRQLSNHDIFTFKFIRLYSDHLQRINSIFFEKILKIVNIIFRSRENFKYIFETYFIFNLVRFK
jgi:hypothetical protein